MTTSEELLNRARWERDRLLAIDRGIPRRWYPLLGIGCEPAGEILRTKAIEALDGHDAGIIVLAGPPGTGKSFAGAGCGWRLRRRGMLFVRAGKVMRAPWFQDPLIDAIMTIPVLVLDDIGAEYGDTKGNWQSKLDEIVDARYAAGDEAATVITSNRTVPQFKDLLGPRAWDRLREGARVVVCDGPSLRKFAGKEDLDE